MRAPHNSWWLLWLVGSLLLVAPDSARARDGIRQTNTPTEGQYVVVVVKDNKRPSESLPVKVRRVRGLVRVPTYNYVVKEVIHQNRDSYNESERRYRRKPRFRRSRVKDQTLKVGDTISTMNNDRFEARELQRSRARDAARGISRGRYIHHHTNAIEWEAADEFILVVSHYDFSLNVFVTEGNGLHPLSAREEIERINIDATESTGGP